MCINQVSSLNLEVGEEEEEEGGEEGSLNAALPLVKIRWWVMR